MDVIRAFTYVFDDPNWFNKIALVALVTALSIVFTPLLIGLLGWAVLFGYLVDLVHNVRLGARYPLPRLDDFNRYLASGANVLAAFIVYSLPNLLLGCVSSILGQNMGGGFIGSSLILALSCCLLPILLVYNAVAMPMLAISIGRYVEEPRVNVFFEFSFLYEAFRQHLDRVAVWWLVTIGAGIVFVILGVIPLLGWAVLAALLIPVYGMLTGQLALEVLGGLKRKPQPPPPAPKRTPRR